MPRPDLTAKYNTPLSPKDEAAFQAWLKANNRQGDLADYDLRGAWKADAKQSANGHFTDEFKKPNHPTFSDESRYNGADGRRGGKWTGDDKTGWAFKASPDNLKNMSAAELRAYFARVEPDSKLILPDTAETLYPNDQPKAPAQAAAAKP